MEGSLFDITERYKQLFEFAADGEIDDEAFADTLQSIEDEIEVKAESYAAVIKNLEVRKGAINGEVEVIQKEVDRRKALVESIDRHINRMKENLCAAMVATGKTKFKTDHFSFWTQEVSEVIVTDEANVPLDYYTAPKPKISKTKIKEALEKGEELPFAHIETHDTARFR